MSNDVDVFLLMDDAFDASAAKGETSLLFDHLWAAARFGASVFFADRQQLNTGRSNATGDSEISSKSTGDT